MPISDQIFKIAQQIAHRTIGFHDRVGPGKDAGDGVTERFLIELTREVISQFTATTCRIQRAGCTPCEVFLHDYFIPSEETAVEIALSLRNIVTEFEKDIFKAILANESGKRVSKLVLIGKDGSVKRQNGTGPNAIKAWVKQHCLIEIEVRELTSLITND